MNYLLFEFLITCVFVRSWLATRELSFNLLCCANWTSIFQNV